MGTCEKCEDYSKEFCFRRQYEPEEFVWGKANSLVWIVGLNPKYRPGYEKQTTAELERYFNTSEKNRSYYQDFRKVSPKLFEMLGKDNGVAHTDIVRCFSNEFPPKGCRGKEVRKIISNCTPHFEKLLQKLMPRLVICNGSPVCKVVKTIIAPIQEKDTFYRGKYNNSDIVVVLSGFVGRIDNYAKRRLGQEIEKVMEELRIG